MARMFKHEINFMGYRNIFFLVSAILIVISLAALGVRGLNFGIEFQGGSSVDFTVAENVTIEQMRQAFADAGDTEAVVQTSETSAGQGYLVRTAVIDPDVAAGHAQQVAEKFGLASDSYRVTTIGPDWGADITRSSLLAFIVSIALIILYIAIRFEFKMGVAAVASLIHDLIIVVGVYAIVGREVTPNTIAALLTIMGYSLYDTVVVFHRIVDNSEESSIKCSPMKLANHSINQVFTRTINTTLTSLIPVVIMLFFGGETLKDFAFAMSIGLLLGSYSSIGIATPLYVLWKQREPKFARLAKKYPDDIKRGMKLERYTVVPKADGIDVQPAVLASSCKKAKDGSEDRNQ